MLIYNKHKDISCLDTNTKTFELAHPPPFYHTPKKLEPFSKKNIPLTQSFPTSLKCFIVQIRRTGEQFLKQKVLSIAVLLLKIGNINLLFNSKSTCIHQKYLFVYTLNGILILFLMFINAIKIFCLHFNTSNVTWICNKFTLSFC